jgi:hypothetical protein
VLAKVLLLSRDREIKDPSILDQLRIATGAATERRASARDTTLTM